MIDLILGIHLVSVHMPTRENQNNLNPGIYAIYDGWTAGAYYNTLKRTSVYLGREINVWGPIYLTLGVVSGYQRKEWEQNEPCPGYDYCIHYKQSGWSRGYLSPMIAPSVKFGPTRVWATTQKEGLVLHLSLERKF